MPPHPAPPLAQLLQANPIVVTGWGIVSAAGTSPDDVWQSVCAGRSPADRLAAPQRGTPFSVCQVKHLSLAPSSARLVHKLDRSAALALSAAEAAWQSASLPHGSLPPERTGIIVGTSRGPMEIWQDMAETRRQPRRVPSWATHSAIASLSGVLSLALRAQGPVLTVSAACASAAAALAVGAQQLLTGAADVVLAGGAEAPLNPVLLAQLDAAGLLGQHENPALACRPFDAHRNGTVPGEGAAFLVLETLASAQRRQANILARLQGWALGAEAGNKAGMDKTGATLTRLMRQALAAAGLAAADIGYLNLHGTGTRLNDVVEAKAVREVFGHRADFWCSSTKPITGHCMGAAAALEAVITIQALRRQTAPPSANCLVPDAACELPLAKHPQPFTARAAISTSAGLWGNQACLVFGRE